MSATRPAGMPTHVRTQWESLYAFFDGVIREAGDEDFAALAMAPTIASFADLQFLVVRGGDLDVRARVLAELVRCARRSETRPPATALLWLALWPGLTGVYRRQLRWRASPDDVVSAITSTFIALVADADLARVTRVAATLVRNTERTVVATLRPRWIEVPLADAIVERLEAPVASFEDELRTVHGWLERFVDRDADLVLAVAVLDEPHAVAAERAGISAATARKRYQRALARVRETYAREAVA